MAFASASPQPFPKDVPAGVPQGTLIYGTFSMANSLALFRVQEPARSYIEKVEALAA